MKGYNLIVLLLVLTVAKSELHGQVTNEAISGETEVSDLIAIFGDLFADESHNRDGRSSIKKSETDDGDPVSDIEQYNIFMDAFYARMQRELKNQDPMTMYVKASRRGNKISPNRQRKPQTKRRKQQKKKKNGRNLELEDFSDLDTVITADESDVLLEEDEEIQQRSQRMNSKQKKRPSRQEIQRRRQQLRRENRQKKRDRRMRRQGYVKAEVSGISSMKRLGDAEVTQKEKTYFVRSNFVLDSVKFQASRNFGRGKKKLTRTAEIVAPVINGNILMKISTDGQASVDKFNLQRPTNIRVTGVLTRNAQAPIIITEQYLRRARPIISRRLEATSKRIMPKNVPELVSQR